MLNLSILDLLVPILGIILSILYVPVTLLTLLVHRRFSEITTWRSFRQAWFGRFWYCFGWASRALFAPDVEKVLAGAHGVVLDIGTGSGDWGVDELERWGVKPGTVDTISTVHVLCSVQSPALLVGDLYRYLKLGGRWLVYEHVKVRRKWSLTAGFQAMINIVWPYFFDGCSMTRETEDLLLHSGKWTSADLRPAPNEGWFNALPHTVGVLVK
ncbi:hypothetical protein FE257_000215 [Aspergillus nanangensis]|uniref:Methyltransferase domain-containing protein n=1 Tax=Aspergillus nanangensis TaxID=2582783 RepID=A0AAD4CZF4_ASPNN|nr:hypothetical protein FE257_000215 [Aspergillus nanangensis]